MLLQTLFENLKCNEKILAGKRVSRIEFVPGGVCVSTEDGSTYNGDIVIGADGIHSTVRREMWRNAHEADSEFAHMDEESSLYPIVTRVELFANHSTAEIQATSKCLFGISYRPKALGSGPIQINAYFDSWNYMMFSAPGNRIYWFLFTGMNTSVGSKIPRFSKADEAKLVSNLLDDFVTENVTFGDIYRERQTSTLLAVEEHVFTRWHFGRVLTIGDAAHKVSRNNAHTALVDRILIFLSCILSPLREVTMQWKRQRCLSMH